MATILIVLMTGMTVAATCGFEPRALAPVGFLLGTSAMVGVGGALTITGVTTSPAINLVVLTGVGIGLGWLTQTGRAGVPISPRIALGSVAMATVLVAAFRTFGFVNVTPDSFRYATTAGLLADDLLEVATPALLLSRALAVPILHAPAGLVGESYLRSMTPLLAIATAWTLAWLIRRALSEALDSRLLWAIQILSVGLLVTNSRFLFHAFYINGHLAIAGWVLLLVGGSWLVERSTRVSVAVPHLMPLQLALLPALALARPDAALLAGLAILPIVLLGQRSALQRALPVGILGLSLLAWNLFIRSRYTDAGWSIPTEVTGLVALGAVAVVASGIVVLQPRLLHPRLLIVTEVGLWVAAVAATVRRPDILSDSVRATIQNTLLDAGGWGASLGILSGLVLVILVATVDRHRSSIRFPVTTFVPLGLLLAFLREGAYRVGPGDSLNRMIIHMVPVAILLVISALDADWRSGPSSMRTTRQGRRAARY